MIGVDDKICFTWKAFCNADMKSNQIIILLSCIVILGIIFPPVFGHGVGYEILPPQMLGDRKVAMEVGSTVDNATNRKQIVFSMFDTNTGLSVRDVTYHIKTIKNNQILFEGSYQTTNGVLTFDLIPDASDKVIVQEKKDSDIFGFLIGAKKSLVEAKGKIFERGGLYKFSIRVVSAENYSDKTQKPVQFESGLSFAEPTIYNVNDKQFGKQELKVVSYYDVFDGVIFDSKTRSVFFSMPFEWTINNINQTSVIHQEVFIPKTFTALQVSEYEIFANDSILPNNAITIDDFVNDYRVIHILLYQTELMNLYEKQEKEQSKIIFSLTPKSDDVLLVDVTENVQYKITMTMMPKQIVSGQETTLLFKIYDVFLQGKAVSVNYDLLVKSGDTVLYQTSGTSSDSKEKWNEAKFDIPKDVANIISVRFENLGGNRLARAEIPLMVSTIDGQEVPSWIKNNAGWWCQKLISDDEFLRGVEYLIDKNIIDVGTQAQSTSQKGIPEWVRSNSCWWSNNSISDNEFVSGIAYLVKVGIIKA